MNTSVIQNRASRILLCVHQFFPEFSAGTEVLVLSTAKAMRDRGFDVRIVTGSLDPLAADTLIHGFKVYRIHTPHRMGGFTPETAREEYDNEAIGPAFSDVLNEFSPDLVHFFHFKNLTLASLRQCYSRSIPTVFTPTDYWFTCRTCQLLKNWGQRECNGPDSQAANCLKHIVTNLRNPAISRLGGMTPTIFFKITSQAIISLKLLRSSKIGRLTSDLKIRKGTISEHLSKLDLILPPTRSIENLLLSENISATRITALRYAIEPPVIRRNIEKSGDARAYVIGFIGTLVEHKGCHVLLEALKHVRHQEIEIRVYGDPRHYPAYVDQLKLLAKDDNRIQFRNTFEPEEIGNILSEMDVLAIPSTWRENAPLVLLNALATGTPVIASDVSGITEYLSPEDDVLMFPAGDAHALAKQLKGAIERTSTSSNATTRSSRPAGSSLQAYAAALDDAYTRLMKRP